MASLNNYYLEEKKRKLDLIILFLIVVTVVSAILLYNKNNRLETLRDELSGKEQKQVEIINNNKKVAEQQRVNNSEVGNSEVIYASSKFNDLYFNWNTWKEYSDNMKELSMLYPNLESSKFVDISGKDVGSGNSPISSYDNSVYTTTNKEEVAELITQTKQYDDRTTERLMFKVSNSKNGKYDIKEFKVYSEAL